MFSKNTQDLIDTLIIHNKGPILTNYHIPTYVYIKEANTFYLVDWGVYLDKCPHGTIGLDPCFNNDVLKSTNSHISTITPTSPRNPGNYGWFSVFKTSSRTGEYTEYVEIPASDIPEEIKTAALLLGI